MKVYGSVTLSEGSDLNNLTVAHGATYPGNPNIGELFFHDSLGLSCYSGSIWEQLSQGGELPDGSIGDVKLTPTGIAAGTYNTVTVNTQGRVIAGDNGQESIIASLGYTPVNKAGDTMTGNLGMPATSGAAIKIGSAYGWKDLIGDVSGKNTGTSAPQQKNLFSTVRAWAYSAGDQGDLLFHIPHDYAPGTDLFLHFHWTHNGTSISGSLIIDCKITYAKGHQQMSFVDPLSSTINLSGLNILNTARFLHKVDEIQLSTPGGSGSMINTSSVEVDGLIMISFTVSQIPAISGSSTGINVPFILSADLHYQTTSLPTKNKSPNFYG